MSPVQVRLAVWSGVLAGLCIGLPGAVEAFTGEIAPTSFVLGVSPALAIPLLVVLHLRQSDNAGPFGALAYTVNVVGLGLFGGAAFSLNLVLFRADEAVLDELVAGPTRFALLGSALLFAVGSVLFGVAMARARVHPRAAAVAYAASLPVLALAAPLPDSPLTSAVHVVAGASVAWLAVSVGGRVPRAFPGVTSLNTGISGPSWHAAEVDHVNGTVPPHWSPRRPRRQTLRSTDTTTPSTTARSPSITS